MIVFFKTQLPRFHASLLIVLVSLTATINGTTAEAVIARTLALEKQDLEDLIRIEAHLNSITTLTARFLQVSSNGEFSEGVIYLSRPGRMRVEYDLPNPVVLIADGSSLIYIDRELEQETAVLLKLTSADFILRKNLSFMSNEILITGFNRSPGVFRVSIVKAAAPLEGQLTLVFSDKPLELRKWTVTDAFGIKTTLSLLGTRFGQKINKDLFDYKLDNKGQDLN
ncbi:MAG: hypothetical protein CBB68_08250 [Rhodospirillaceae bacterium TMED8]|nr:hypothetical protein [Magnetovibrio sp.]OUT50365.1 MAG: hypothetical protein CBB68_08250 [Rhodospirillaceae bacterium TMED8]|tara:strand:+ start:1562 stop:2236 length:675 start_codon:yes stop_codon:yes gene_type:complete